MPLSFFPPWLYRNKAVKGFCSIDLFSLSKLTCPEKGKCSIELVFFFIVWGLAWPWMLSLASKSLKMLNYFVLFLGSENIEQQVSVFH